MRRTSFFVFLTIVCLSCPVAVQAMDGPLKVLQREANQGEAKA